MAADRQEAYSLVETLRSEEGILTIGPARGIVMTESAFVLLQQVIAENMPELVKYGFYEMGYRAGIDFAGKAAVTGESAEQGFRYFVETYMQSGYGQINVEQFDLAKPEATLHGRNLIETAAARASRIYRTPRAVDHYSRGMFAGLFSQLLGKEVICEELRCQYRGDEVCEFRVLPFASAD